MPSRFKNIEQKADDKNNDDNNDNEDASTPKVVPGHHLYSYLAFSVKMVISVNGILT